MTREKKHWYDFLTTKTDVDAGPVHIKRIPVVCLLLMTAILVVGGIFAWREYMRAPEPVRKHKIDAVRQVVRP